MATTDTVPTLSTAPRASLSRLYAIGHPWAKQAIAYADAKSPPYGDYGQWHALAYAMTGRTEYATTAADRIIKAAIPANPDKPVANDVRQNFADLVYLSALISPAIDDNRKAQLRAAFNRTCEYCFAINFPQYVGGFRTGDSDQTIGQLLGVWLTDLVYSTSWRAYTPAAATAVDWSRAVQAVHDYLAMSKGGEFIESYHYNLNTVMLLLTARVMLGDEFAEVFPEFDGWVDECATFFLASLTPDGQDIYKWGDIDSAWNGLDLHRVLVMLYSLYHLTGRRDVWATIEKVEGTGAAQRPLKDWFYLAWRLAYSYRPAPGPLPPVPPPPPAPKTTEERLAALELGQSQLWAAIYGTAPITAPVATVTAPAVAIAPKPRTVFISTGNGQVRYNDGRVLFGSHTPCAGWKGDHACAYTSDFRAWANGVWWIDRPDGYGADAVSGFAGNSPLFAGYSSMWAVALKVEETDTGVVVTSTTAGSAFAPGAYSPLLPFVSAFERRLAFDRSGRVTVRDTFEGKDPRPVRDAAGKVTADPFKWAAFALTSPGKRDLPVLERELGAGRLWQQVWQCPSEPRETATGFEYRVPGLDEPVIVVVPPGVKREVLLTSAVLGGHFGPQEIPGWYQIRLSSMAERVVMETALQIGA